MHEKVKYYRISDVAFWRKMFCLLWQRQNFETFWCVNSRVQIKRRK